MTAVDEGRDVHPGAPPTEDGPDVIVDDEPPGREVDRAEGLVEPIVAFVSIDVVDLRPVPRELEHHDIPRPRGADDVGERGQDRLTCGARVVQRANLEAAPL